MSTPFRNRALTVLPNWRTMHSRACLPKWTRGDYEKLSALHFVTHVLPTISTKLPTRYLALMQLQLSKAADSDPREKHACFVESLS